MDCFDLYRQLPDEWVGLDERAILQRLKQPTIFHCSGHDPGKCVVVSCLLHGNEPSGYIAVLEELKRHARGVSRYRYDVIFLVGNVEAAKQDPVFALCQVDGGQDLNRIWRQGVELAGEWEFFMRDKNPTAVLDLHNTSGEAQPFSVWTQKNEATIRLSNVLAGTHLFMPEGMNSFIAFNSRFAPSVAVECGKRLVGQSDEHARVTLQRFFLATQIVRGNPERYFFRKVYTNLKQVVVHPEVSFSFGSGPVQGQVIVRRDLERLNFMDLKPGEVLGWAPRNYLIYKKNQLPTEDLIEWFDGELRLKAPTVIIMATPDLRVAKSDCLFYVGEEMV